MGFEDLVQLFRFGANWNLPGIILTITLALAYLAAVGPLRRFFPESTPVGAGKRIWFLSGLLLGYITLGSPLNLLAHELFSIHMLQMSLIYLVLPPFFLLGMPEWMIRPLIRVPGVKAVITFFTHPVVALFLFNGLLSVYHVPLVFDAIMENEWLHTGVHILLGVVALFFWWPVVPPVAEMDRLSELKKIGYIFAGGALLTPACALIIFADVPMFEMYKEMSTLAPVLPPLDDQQLGGVLMKIIQEISYGFYLGYNFFRWVNKERAKERESRGDHPPAPTFPGGPSGKPRTNP